ncbi:MAG: hypothetical protein WD273_13020 [Trueperaceae bacterium]
MFEESPDGFISRWRSHAAFVQIFSRTEGLPLLELEAGGAIFQVLERTGPYLAPPGNAKAIINATVDSVEIHTGGRKFVEAASIGHMRGCGIVTLREDPFLVLDVGVPLVVGFQGRVAAEVMPGVWVSFEALPPIHGFVLHEPRSTVPRGPEGEAP